MMPTSIRPATLDDLPYIDHQRKREGTALGFIPIERYRMEIERERLGTICVVEDNGDLTGFVYATHGRGASHIQQVVVREDARRIERATLLIEKVIADSLSRGNWLLSLRCRADLESNLFWRALSFDWFGISEGKSFYGQGKEKASKSKRPINIWQKEIAGLWVPVTYPPVSEGWQA